MKERIVITILTLYNDRIALNETWQGSSMKFVSNQHLFFSW